MADAEHERPGSQEAQALGRKWLELGQAYLAGLAEHSARPRASGRAEPHGAAAGPFEAAEALVDAWRNAWTGMTAAQAGTAEGLADWLARMPALGPNREQALLMRELAEAQAECRRLEQELSAVLMNVQSDALKLMEQRLGTSASPAGYRELYDLWVECGEQVYAQVAHSEAYCKLQGSLGNATMRLRSRQQTVIEHLLKQFDLPTRSELNTLHRQVRELRQQLAALERGGTEGDPS